MPSWFYLLYISVLDANSHNFSTCLLLTTLVDDVAEDRRINCVQADILRVMRIMMMKWLLVASIIVLLGAVLAVIIGRAIETSKADRLLAILHEGASQTASGLVDFASFSELPPPVARYFRLVLTDGQPLIRTTEMQQSGVLRTDMSSDTWLPFTASQVVVPPATGFIWNATVGMPLRTHLRVLDSYVGGVGAGRVSLLSAFTVASEANVPELNSGALHRYLAEGVFFPTALLPASGVVWQPIDEHSALATLSDHGISVSLEFRFNEAGEVTGIYSAGRFGQFDGGYRLVPWEGHFRDYHEQNGMRIPSYGEVGWYQDGVLQLVWKGSVLRARHEL